MSNRRILIADDHPLVREGLARLMSRLEGWELCGQAETGQQAVEMAATCHPDVAILDFHLPGMNGIEATRRIKKKFPSCEVIILTGIESEAAVRSAFDAGAKCFLSKTDGLGHLESAVRALADHKPYFTPRAGEILFATMLEGKKARPSSSGEDKLSEREREVLQLVAEGATNKEVASRLGISAKTVETHRAAIMAKLKLESVSALVRYAIRQGIIQP